MILRDMLLFVIFLFAILSIMIVYQCSVVKNHLGYCLSHAGIFVILILFFYSISILAKSEIVVSIFTSLYMFAISSVLGDFVNVAYIMVKQKFTKAFKIFNCFLYFYLIVDLVFVLINPVSGILFTIEYDALTKTFIRHYTSYIYLHFLYTYFMSAVIGLVFLKKSRSIARPYRLYYIIPIITIGGVAIFNLFNVCLIATNTEIFLTRFDFTVLSYPILLTIYYWNCFEYYDRTMLNTYRKWIVNSINEGVIVFNDVNEPMLHNENALSIFGVSDVDSLQQTLLDYHVEINNYQNESSIFQIYHHFDSKYQTINIQYHPIIEKEKLVGKLLVLLKVDDKIDELTGFITIEHFLESVKEVYATSYANLSISTFDINGLSLINNNLGMNEGDRLLNRLAAIMRENFPDDAKFLRGKEALLYAIHIELNSIELEKICNRVIEQFYDENIKDNYPITCEYAICNANGRKDIQALIEEVDQTLKTKKILSDKSVRSENLNSLIKVLEQTDTSTQQHVIRTRTLGEKLAKRLGLSELQNKRLSILCLVHDIGKIGIPLEILNKPGNLTSEEWEVVRSHVNKGYQIVNSIDSTKDIANDVLYHHERWDGKGYPSGLSKDSIPLLARIISIVDAYDAMVSDRIYRKGIQREAALMELKKGAGFQFDPNIVTEFIEMMKEPDEVYETLEMPIINENQHEYMLESEISNMESNITEARYTKYTTKNLWEIIKTDHNFEEITGYNEQDITKGLSQLDLIPTEDINNYILMVRRLAQVDSTICLEHPIVHKNGSVKQYLCIGRMYYDSVSHEELAEITLIDTINTSIVNNAKAIAKEQFETQVLMWQNKYRYEPLTGLYIREVFKTIVNEKCLADQCVVAMLYFDINKFKEVNDKHGHLAGDQCLIDLAQGIKNVLNNEDVPCRMGGDEFACALFFSKDTSEDKIIQKCKRIFRELNKHMSSVQYPATISMGVVISDEQNNTFIKLYDKADKALYIAKNAENHFHY